MKNTKTKLISSVTVLLICFAMLIGSTFAWFTDSASTGVNKIQAGNLDIQIVDSANEMNEINNLEWVAADGRPQDQIFWEPGATYKLQSFKLKNNGSLALRCKISIEITGETAGVGDGKLSDVLVWKLNSEDFNQEKEYHLESGDLSEAIEISAFLPTNVDNDYQKASINSIKINVNATQDTVEKDSFSNTYDVASEYPTGSGTTNTASVKTAAELKAVLTSFTDAGSGNSVVNITENIALTEGETWTPVIVDGYNGAGVITIEGNNHTITGLNDALFSGGFAGSSGIVIKDLTLKEVRINDETENQGIGAFIKKIDSMPKIELINCHLIDSTIVSTGGARVGGLIGWTAGYDNQNNGAVDTYVTIKGCSVKNSSITAKGSVGAIIGHAGTNPATYHTITNCTVTGTTLHSTDNEGWRVGVVVGTANVGKVEISRTTESGNTLTQVGKTAPSHSNLYGRFVPQDGNGELTIDGVPITE